MTPLQRAGEVPLYRQIERLLRGELAQASGASRPRFTENSLMARFGVSRYTVRQALALLAQDGLIVRRHRGGTFASARPPIEQPLGGVYGFASSMQDLGLAATSQVLLLRTVPARGSLQERLNAQAGQPLLELERLREADGEPVMLETIWIDAELVPGFPELDLTGSVYALLASRYGLQVTSAREVIRPVVLDARQAALLHARRGAPALFVERLSLQGSRPVEVRHSVIRGDRYLYSIHLRGPADAAAVQAFG
ncbi:MAG TPA: GntR family transcriptional regulator [Chloroflexota bacterium]|nr:GntR family transcriptional regulator [Chloroflexota bacterium]